MYGTKPYTKKYQLQPLTFNAILIQFLVIVSFGKKGTEDSLPYKWIIQTFSFSLVSDPSPC